MHSLKPFRLGYFHSLTAILVILFNIYMTQDGIWSSTAILGLAISGVHGTVISIMVSTHESTVLRKLEDGIET